MQIDYYTVASRFQKGNFAHREKFSFPLTNYSRAAAPRVKSRCQPALALACYVCFAPNYDAGLDHNKICGKVSKKK
jgi:hypothetical protein